MFRAALFRDDESNPAPTPEQIRQDIGSEAKLLYLGGRRKRVSAEQLLRYTEHTDKKIKFYVLTDCINKFKHVLDRTWHRSLVDQHSHQLFIFEKTANCTPLCTRYSAQVVSLFTINDHLVERIKKLAWCYDRLAVYKENFVGVSETKELLNNGIGTRSFIEDTIPSFMNAQHKMIAALDREIILLEQEAYNLLNTGWR